jgi:hypothetical protein
MKGSLFCMFLSFLALRTNFISPARRELMRIILAIVLLTPTLLCAQQIDLQKTRMIDLSHAINAATLYWPNAPSAFQLDRLFFGVTPAGFFTPPTDCPARSMVAPTWTRPFISARRKSDDPRSAARARGRGHCAADEDRRRVGRRAARHRPGTAVTIDAY